MTAAVYVKKKEDNTIVIDMSKELEHAVLVSKLAGAVGQELKLDPEVCRELAIAGLLHDIGRLKLVKYIYSDENPMLIEELKYARMHSQLGYEAVKDHGYSQFVLDSILYHHENYDGSGYPANLRGDAIPYGARILHVCDVFAAMQEGRPHRSAVDLESAMQKMINEVKNFDMEIFLAFQRVVHKDIL